MTVWLLDTNILSELRRPAPEARVRAFVAAQPLDRLYVSAATFAEIRCGIELVADPGRRAELHVWLTHKLRPMFAQRILPITEGGCSGGGSWSRKDAGPGTRFRSPI